MTSTPLVVGRAWQCDRPLSSNDVESFHAKVERRADGHWIWHGAYCPTPSFFVPNVGKQVSATRVAFAIANPGQFIPLRFKRILEICTDDHCINPDHFTYKTERPHIRPREEFEPRDQVPFSRPRFVEPAPYSPPGPKLGRQIEHLTVDRMVELIWPTGSGASIVSYPSGHTWVFGPNGKAEGDTVREAIQNYLNL